MFTTEHGENNSSFTKTIYRMGDKYEWSPDPVLSVFIFIITVVIILSPAVCSGCYHYHKKHYGVGLEKQEKLPPVIYLVGTPLSWIKYPKNSRCSCPSPPSPSPPPQPSPSLASQQCPTPPSLASHTCPTPPSTTYRPSHCRHSVPSQQKRPPWYRAVERSEKNNMLILHLESDSLMENYYSGSVSVPAEVKPSSSTGLKPVSQSSGPLASTQPANSVHVSLPSWKQKPAQSSFNSAPRRGCSINYFVKPTRVIPMKPISENSSSVKSSQSEIRNVCSKLENMNQSRSDSQTSNESEILLLQTRL